jgi:protein TonB
LVDGEPEPQVFVEENPAFPGGEDARLRYLKDNLIYPPIAREAGIQGTVYVNFVVEKDGSITNVKILRSVGGGCDEEAIRVVQDMPRWSPGKQHHKTVRVLFTMSIKFVLNS